MKETNNSTRYNWVGVDVSQAKLDVYDLSSQHYTQYDNSEIGLASLSQALLTVENVAVVCEAMGGDELLMTRRLPQQESRISVVTPRAVRDLVKGFKQWAKTDRIDAKMIATDGALVVPRPFTLASAAAEALKGSAAPG